MKTMTSMTKLFSLALVATMTVAGCAQQLDDIDQVQNKQDNALQGVMAKLEAIDKFANAFSQSLDQLAASR